MLALIKKENQENIIEEHDDIQQEAVQSYQPSRKKNDLLKRPISSRKLRAGDIAAGEIDWYIHSPCPEVNSNSNWWKTHYVDYSHLACH